MGKDAKQRYWERLDKLYWQWKSAIERKEYLIADMIWDELCSEAKNKP